MTIDCWPCECPNGWGNSSCQCWPVHQRRAARPGATSATQTIPSVTHRLSVGTFRERPGGDSRTGSFAGVGVGHCVAATDLIQHVSAGFRRRNTQSFAAAGPNGVLTIGTLATIVRCLADLLLASPETGDGKPMRCRNAGIEIRCAITCTHRAFVVITAQRASSTYAGHVAAGCLRAFAQFEFSAITSIVAGPRFTTTGVFVGATITIGFTCLVTPARVGTGSATTIRTRAAARMLDIHLCSMLDALLRNRLCDILRLGTRLRPRSCTCSGVERYED